MEIYLDGRALDSREALHQALAALLAFPAYYGKNLDALHDILTGQPYLGRSFIIVLPEAGSPCRTYAERIANEFTEAGLPVEIKN